MKKLISILLFVLVAACATQADIDSWIGSSYDSLLLTYGVPSAEASLSNGNRMVEFYHSRMLDANEYYCTLRFILSQEDIVLQGNSTGNIGGCNRLIEAR